MPNSTRPDTRSDALPPTSPTVNGGADRPAGRQSAPKVTAETPMGRMILRITAEVVHFVEGAPATREPVTLERTVAMPVTRDFSGDFSGKRVASLRSTALYSQKIVEMIPIIGVGSGAVDVPTSLYVDEYEQLLVSGWKVFP